MKNLVVVLSLAMLIFTGLGGESCKSSKVAKTGNNDYRLIVSFISKGSGIDGKIQESFLSLVENHPLKPAYEAYIWGREGEIDYCFQLKEMKSKEQDKFIESVKKVIEPSDIVQVLENAPCVHKK